MHAVAVSVRDVVDSDGTAAITVLVNTVIAAVVAVADLVVTLLDSYCYYLLMEKEEEEEEEEGRRRGAEDGECTQKPEPQSNDMGKKNRNQGTCIS